MILLEQGDMEDWVYLQCIMKCQFVGDRRDHLLNGVRAYELGLQFASWAAVLGSNIDVGSRE